jgi:hypothetical protein
MENNVTYNWSVTGLVKKSIDTVDGVVVQVHWTITANDDEFNTEYYGVTNLNFNEESLDSFIDFTELTEETVLDWVKGGIDESYMDSIYGILQEELDKLKNHIQFIDESNLPWRPDPIESGNNDEELNEVPEE